METAASLLKGRHDFSSFSGARRKRGIEKTLFDIRFDHVKENTFPASKDTDTLVISLTADDFLYQMPLRIVSVLLEIGMQKRTADVIPLIFSGKETSAVTCETKGLLLTSIKY